MSLRVQIRCTGDECRKRPGKLDQVGEMVQERAVTEQKLVVTSQLAGGEGEPYSAPKKRTSLSDNSKADSLSQSVN